MTTYLESMVSGLWNYQKKVFPIRSECFDRNEESKTRPPVFLKENADYNVLVEPSTSDEKRKKILNEIPVKSRHRYFNSMKSSQALAQSVFANLKHYNKLHLLEDLTCDNADPLFEYTPIIKENFFMEYDIDFLGEPRRTNLDCFIANRYKIAVECKMTESEFGNCSRPRLTERDSNYGKDYCDGSYTRQRSRNERCSLTEIGVLYWKYIPELFSWRNDIDLDLCPIRATLSVSKKCFSCMC